MPVGGLVVHVSQQWRQTWGMHGQSDKRHARREPISGRMVADVIEAIGVDHVITMDLHAPQIEGFFHIPVDSLTAISDTLHHPA